MKDSSVRVVSVLLCTFVKITDVYTLDLCLPLYVNRSLIKKNFLKN